MEEALSIPNGNVTSIYSPKYVDRHLNALEHFQSGNIIFTFPASPVKCPGAPQKICYITEHFLRKTNKRKQAHLYYNSALPTIFGCKYFADALWKVAEKRAIDVNLKTNLIEVQSDKNVAVFANVDNPNERKTFEVCCFDFFIRKFHLIYCAVCFSVFNFTCCTTAKCAFCFARQIKWFK